MIEKNKKEPNITKQIIDDALKIVQQELKTESKV
jgi:hypothetical protein